MSDLGVLVILIESTSMDFPNAKLRKTASQHDRSIINVLKEKTPEKIIIVDILIANYFVFSFPKLK